MKAPVRSKARPAHPPHLVAVLCAWLLALACVAMTALHAPQAQAAAYPAQVFDIVEAMEAFEDPVASADAAPDTEETADKRGPSCCQQMPDAGDAESCDRECLWPGQRTAEIPPALRHAGVLTAQPQFWPAPLQRPPKARARA